MIEIKLDDEDENIINVNKKEQKIYSTTIDKKYANTFDEKKTKDKNKKEKLLHLIVIIMIMKIKRKKRNSKYKHQGTNINNADCNYKTKFIIMMIIKTI